MAATTGKWRDDPAKVARWKARLSKGQRASWRTRTRKRAGTKSAKRAPKVYVSTGGYVEPPKRRRTRAHTLNGASGGVLEGAIRQIIAEELGRMFGAIAVGVAGGVALRRRK